MPTVEADEPIDPLAVAEKLGREGRLPSEVGVTFWLRLVLGERNGRIQVAEVSLTPTAKIPLGWDGPMAEDSGDGL